MSSNLVVPTAILIVVVAAAFVVGRIRVGDWQPRRDGLVLGAVAAMGVVALLLLFAPRTVAIVGISAALTVMGLYLLANRGTIENDEPLRRSLILVAAAGAFALGLFGLVMAGFELAS